MIINRNTSKTYTHTQEKINGVWYLVTHVYTDITKPAEQIIFTRADLVKG